MIQYFCADCGFKGTQYQVYEYGSIRLCSDCCKSREKDEEYYEREQERRCIIQDTKLDILKHLRTWHCQGLFLPAVIKKLEAMLD